MNAVLTEQTPAQLAKGCEAINRLEAEMAKHPPCEYGLVHRFTLHMCSREWSAKAGVKCTTRVHRTEHQFIISKGKVRIWMDGKGWQVFAAPYHGITKPGTKRVLDILEDLIFTTFHATDTTDIAALEAELAEPDLHLDALVEAQKQRAIA